MILYDMVEKTSALVKIAKLKAGEEACTKSTEGGRLGLLRMYRDVHLLAQIIWLIKRVMGLKFYINNLFNSYILG